MLKIEKGKRYIMVRVDKAYIGIGIIVMTTTPDFSSTSTLLNYRVVGDNGLCFDDSPIHSSLLFTNLCAHFEHWVTLAHGWALIDSKENVLKYCRKAILWEYFRDENMLPFRQNMPAYEWICCAAYQKVITRLRELKL